MDSSWDGRLSRHETNAVPDARMRRVGSLFDHHDERPPPPAGVLPIERDSGEPERHRSRRCRIGRADFAVAILAHSTRQGGEGGINRRGVGDVSWSPGGWTCCPGLGGRCGRGSNPTIADLRGPPHGSHESHVPGRFLGTKRLLRAASDPSWLVNVSLRTLAFACRGTHYALCSYLRDASSLDTVSVQQLDITDFALSSYCSIAAGFPRSHPPS